MTKVPEYKSADLIITYLKETLDSFLAENGISYGQIETCGIGIPGTVSKDGKIALKTPNLGWENEAVAEKFQNLTGLPTRLIQDSRAAAWGEYKAGGGQGKQIVVCITLGTGIGTGIVINGEILTVRLMAPEK
jgi:glucokinase